MSRSKSLCLLVVLVAICFLSSPASAGEIHDFVTGTNWLDPFISEHTNHVTWDKDPTSDHLIKVKVLVHNHGNLTPEKLDRFDDAIAEVNSAAANFGVLLNLQTVTKGRHNIHLHEDTTSGCGAGALGCAEFAVFIKHSGKFADGHDNHRFAGEETNGGTAEATVLTRSDWYTGGNLSIPSGEFDYQTVAVQELLHLVGLDHDSTVYDSDDETIGNTDRRSVMHGSLGQGIVRRLMSTHDQEVLGHLYGPGQTSGDGDGGGGGGGRPDWAGRPGGPNGLGAHNVPEPSTLVLAALGLLGSLVYCGWRRRKR